MIYQAYQMIIGLIVSPQNSMAIHGATLPIEYRKIWKVAIQRDAIFVKRVGLIKGEPKYESSRRWLERLIIWRIPQRICTANALLFW